MGTFHPVLILQIKKWRLREGVICCDSTHGSGGAVDQSRFEMAEQCLLPLPLPLWRTSTCPAYLGSAAHTCMQPCLCQQWMKLHSTEKSLGILCQNSPWGPEQMVSGWGPSTNSPAPATHLGSVSSMGLTLLGALPPFPSRGDPLHSKPQPTGPSSLKSPPWPLSVSQGLAPHSSCSPTSASFQALHFTGLPERCTPASHSPALSDAG